MMGDLRFLRLNQMETSYCDTLAAVCPCLPLRGYFVLLSKNTKCYKQDAEIELARQGAHSDAQDAGHD